MLREQPCYIYITISTRVCKLMCMTESDASDEEQLYLCQKCDKMLPLDHFKMGSQCYLCHMHLKEKHKVYVMGTLDKRE